MTRLSESNIDLLTYLFNESIAVMTLEQHMHKTDKWHRAVLQYSHSLRHEVSPQSTSISTPN